MSFDNVVMSNVYMKDLDEFGKMNAIYGEFFKLAGCATGGKQIHTTSNVYPAIGPYWSWEVLRWK